VQPKFVVALAAAEQMFPLPSFQKVAAFAGL
jgi:hypothetical protein